MHAPRKSLGGHFEGGRVNPRCADLGLQGGLRIVLRRNESLLVIRRFLLRLAFGGIDLDSLLAGYGLAFEFAIFDGEGLRSAPPFANETDRPFGKRLAVDFDRTAHVHGRGGFAPRTTKKAAKKAETAA